jgi:hypothetical protein
MRVIGAGDPNDLRHGIGQAAQPLFADHGVVGGTRDGDAHAGRVHAGPRTRCLAAVGAPCHVSGSVLFSLVGGYRIARAIDAISWARFRSK